MVRHISHKKKRIKKKKKNSAYKTTFKHTMRIASDPALTSAILRRSVKRKEEE